MAAARSARGQHIDYRHVTLENAENAFNALLQRAHEPVDFGFQPLGQEITQFPGALHQAMSLDVSLHRNCRSQRRRMRRSRNQSRVSSPFIGISLSANHRDALNLDKKAGNC